MNSTKVAHALKYSIIILSLVALAGCSQLLGFLKPGGITANAQVGKENVQQVVGKQESEEVTVSGNTGPTTVVKADSAITADSVAKAISSAPHKAVVSGPTITPSVVADSVEEVKTAVRTQDVVAGPGSRVVVNQNDRYPAWLLFLLVLGWVMPTPVDMMNWVLNRFRRRNNNEVT